MGYLMKKGFAAAVLLLIVGGLAWGWMAMTGKNPVAKVFGKWAPAIYALVGIAAFVVLLRGRNSFLPFLGPTVFPCAALKDMEPENADTTVEVQVRPGAKVLYWGAEPASDGLKTLKSWKDAYLGYANTGVATADESGVAILRLRTPQPYKVPLKGRLESHVHYRVCMADGWLSQVETHVLHSEAFQNEQQTQSQPQPQPQQPTIPVVASTPELPVIADPVSGIPTAIPDMREKKVAGAETPSPIEGFSNEPIYSTAEGDANAMLGIAESEDPRLQRLRSTIETNAIQSQDLLGLAGFSPDSEGTELDAAFQPSIRPAGPPSRAWEARLQ